MDFHVFLFLLCIYGALGETNTTCTSDNDCLNSKFVCAKPEMVCRPKSLFPLSRFDLIGTFGAFIACALAAGGGLGGGGLLVPLYMIVLGQDPHDAIPLSKATIFGNAIASFIVNIQKKHPLVPNRPLIDYECMLMMEPMTLAGTIIGVNLNTIFPEWLITILLVILLTKTTQRTYRKGIKIYRKETEKDRQVVGSIVQYWKVLTLLRQEPKLESAYHCATKWKSYRRQQPVKHFTEVEMVNMNSKGDEEADIESEYLIGSGEKHTGLSGIPTSLQDLQRYKQTIPVCDMLVLFFTWIGLFVFSLMKGGHGAPSILGIECGTFEYWGLYAISVPFFVCITMYFGFKTVDRHRQMQSAGYEYVEGDMHWTNEDAVKFPGLCMFAGVAAGLLGIGGGMVKGPLLLEMGLLAQVSAATSASMILFTSSATTIQYVVIGALQMDYAIWFGIIGFFAGLTGQYVLGYFVKKYRKTSLVIFLIAIVIGISGLTMGLIGIRNMMLNGFGEFHSICFHRSIGT